MWKYFLGSNLCLFRYFNFFFNFCVKDLFNPVIILSCWLIGLESQWKTRKSLPQMMKQRNYLRRDTWMLSSLDTWVGWSTSWLFLKIKCWVLGYILYFGYWSLTGQLMLPWLMQAGVLCSTDTHIVVVWIKFCLFVCLFWGWYLCYGGPHTLANLMLRHEIFSVSLIGSEYVLAVLPWVIWEWKNKMPWKYGNYFLVSNKEFYWYKGCSKRRAS